MVELRFHTQRLRREVSDLVLRRGHEETGRRLSLRLQQLSAMASPRDLGFLPCEVRRDDTGRLMVTVNEELTLVLTNTTVERDGLGIVHVLTVVDMRWAVG